MSSTSILKISNLEEASRKYEKLLLSKPEVKKVKRGGCDVRFITQDKTEVELVTTYSFKTGFFGKEKTVVVTLPLKREANGDYAGRIDESFFRILVNKKGNFEEEWSGTLEEARGKIPDIVNAYLEDINDLKAQLSG